jgi:hypothetical protein
MADISDASVIFLESIKYLGFTLIHRALQYSQYAGYHPAWAQSMIAATSGFGPGDRMILGGRRSLLIYA